MSCVNSRLLVPIAHHQCAMELSNLRVKELTEICKRLGACYLWRYYQLCVYELSDLLVSLSPGIRSSGKKADLVERLASSSAYHESLSKRGGARPNGVSMATKRAASAEVIMLTAVLRVVIYLSSVVMCLL